MSSIASPAGRLVEQSSPRVPHVIPAAEMVPPSGFVIVNSSPEGRSQLARSIRPAATPTTPTRMTSSATARAARR